MKVDGKRFGYKNLKDLKFMKSVFEIAGESVNKKEIYC